MSEMQALDCVVFETPTAALPMSGVFERGVFRLPLRVFFEDTDFTGVVYHANYIKFAERGRTESLRFLNLVENGGNGSIHQVLKEQFGLFFAVKDCSLSFESPARVDELLEVRTRLKPARGATLDFEQKIMRGDELLTSVELRVVLLREKDGGLARPPRELKSRLEALWQ
ncbi:YbgC/FadM family acyl-CoA thioesterase [Kiloniella sp. b19]|uniref:YbgC/FadM family acyl-CoA thioesterase n=1 Tax=Kiloniella sp. GXU_MW_B19 TaxID=3141326 RepID=UPI0031E0F94C